MYSRLSFGQPRAKQGSGALVMGVNVMSSDLSRWVCVAKWMIAGSDRYVHEESFKYLSLLRDCARMPRVSLVMQVELTLRAVRLVN